MEAPEEGCVLLFQLEKKRTFSSKVDVKIVLFNFESVLTLKGPGFSDFVTARGGRRNFVIQRPITMKFAVIIPHQKFYPATLKLLNYFWLRPGRKCWKILNSLSFL